jgi:biopolymer transport protein ExbD
MQFFSQKNRKRTAPTIIIVSLIDILIVLLIFLMVTTTFRRQPAVQLALPESRQAKSGASEFAMVVTVSKQPPYLYLDTREVELDRLQTELTLAVQRHAEVNLSIRADTDAPFGQIVKVMDAAKAAGIKQVSAYTKSAAQR